MQKKEGTQTHTPHNQPQKTTNKTPKQKHLFAMLRTSHNFSYISAFLTYTFFVAIAMLC